MICEAKICLHICFINSALSSVNETVIVFELIINPKNWISFEGVKIGFSIFTVNPRLSSNLAVVFTFPAHTVSEPLTSKVSSMYAMFENHCFRKVEKAGFINFVKILGADAKPIAKHVYWYFCPFQKKRKYFLSLTLTLQE